ncbi:MAG: hypothetical protein ACQXXH_01540 [Candidatus Bathyarchaeia archaeon]|jgi:uncharacterized membrane protein|nr:hypothetical protein [Candidatus Bathyarchaeota archaeon A05DMB-4]MDH7596082.1 hypothetical protein [Candidatus Bathyarchaeota archaeon]
MNFPLDFWNLSLWLAVTAIILLITSEMLSPYYGKVKIRINRKRLKNISFTVAILFLATVAVRIVNIILTP